MTESVAVVAVRDPLLRVEQVGEVLGKSRVWVFRLIKTGDLKSVKIGGSRRIRQSDLEAYIAELVPDLPGDRPSAGGNGARAS